VSRSLSTLWGLGFSSTLAADGLLAISSCRFRWPEQGEELSLNHAEHELANGIRKPGMYVHSVGIRFAYQA